LKTLENTKIIKLREPKEQPKYQCDFCDKVFVRESGLMLHACTKKKRWMLKDEKYVKLGFFAYQRFYFLSYSASSKREKSYKDFISSQYFLAFTAFAKYLLSISAIDQEGFIDFLIKNNAKLDHWTDERYYEEWIREVGKKEPLYQALERNILLAESWAKKTGELWTDFFRKINPQLATQWLKAGRISPWLIYSEVGAPLIARLTDEQLDIISNIIEPDFWAKKIQTNSEELLDIIKVLKDAGM
jgi:hypothetical protein